ncbi:MAG: TetR/AcrR family transcriptional regulator [Acidobacteriota bacterium]|nr:TetR/AcrR family transcriptional regulator [Acidobacteriota bacterium]
MGRPAKVRREQVLAAARDAFVRGGYDGTTLADISGRLGVSPAALLRHAPTKQALFTAAMGETPGPEMLPLAFLAQVPGNADPAAVLRQVANAFVPFIQAKLHESLGRWVHFKRVAGLGRLPLPFDPASHPTPPQRNLKLLEDYLRRARRAGRVRLRNPRAAAVAFAASLHSFVMLQEVVQALEDPLPLEEYLDTLIDVWRRGVIAKGATP